MRSFWRRSRAAAIGASVSLAAATALIGAGGVAQAAVTAQTGPAGALAVAQALASATTHVTGASFVTQPPNGTPDGTSTTALGGFPTEGSSFGILTTGNVNSVPQTSTFADTDDGGGNFRGNTDFDVSILKTDLNVPTGANCLTFDFKFLSEEYPGYVGTNYNDGFVAELDNSTWTTNGSTISAPDDFAFDSSHQVVSINSTGLGGLSAANGAGTAFDGNQPYQSHGYAPNGNAGGATGLLHASTPVTAGAHSVYFSIFDQGDHQLDSAVFLDNLTVGFVPDPSVNCVPGAHPANYGLTLVPATGSDPTGTPHTVTATLTAADGSPVTGAPVDFTVSGANATTGTATTDASGQASFTYTGTNEGTDQIAACYQPSGATSCLAVASATETWTDAPITATHVDVSATEGEPFTGPVATFTDPDTTAVPSDYAASVNWGDGNSSPGVITGGNGNFTVTGNDTYVEEGSYPVSVTITDTDNPANAQTVTGTATVADAPLHASGATITSANPVHGTVATFTDDDPAGTVSDYTATIDWGDGSTSAGTVSGTGPFNVSGTHTYADLGPYTVKVHVCDAGGSCADATSQVLVYGQVAGGAFVASQDSGSVTYWSSQWSKANPTSGTAAQFKGFENGTSSPSCPGSWTAAPGNSGEPPATVPTYMPVIVTSSLTKSGSTIGGDVHKVVIVKTDPGYGPDPGHPGTGTVVATICG